VRSPARLRLAVLVLVVLGLSWAALAGCGDETSGDAADAVATASPQAEEILAWVEGEPITQADVDVVLAEARLAGEGGDQEAALEEAIGRVLVRREAERLGITVDDAALEERLGAVGERLGGEDALTARLQTAAMTREQFRQGASDGLLRERVRDQKFADRQVSDEALRRFYDENREQLFSEPAAVKLGSILFRGENAAKGVAGKLRAGKAFEDMARTYSMDPETKQNGGLLGWVTVSSLPEPLARAAEGLRRNEISEVVQGPGGWFVLKGELRVELDRRERLQALEGWLERERERVQVERAGD
jgi:parvulin-like peptidyl-prolyl isomerase